MAAHRRVRDTRLNMNMQMSMNIVVEEILLAEISWAGRTGRAWLTEGGNSGF